MHFLHDKWARFFCFKNNFKLLENQIGNLLEEINYFGIKLQIVLFKQFYRWIVSMSRFNVLNVLQEKLYATHLKIFILLQFLKS